MPWGVTFDSSKFGHTFVGRKATRTIREFLTAIPVDNLLYACTNNRDLSSFFSPSQLHQLRLQFKVPKEYADSFSDEEIYSWIPEEYLELFQSVAGGEKWAHSQIGFIRQFFMSS